MTQSSVTGHRHCAYRLDSRKTHVHENRNKPRTSTWNPMHNVTHCKYKQVYFINQIKYLYTSHARQTRHYPQPWSTGQIFGADSIICPFLPYRLTGSAFRTSTCPPLLPLLLYHYCYCYCSRHMFQPLLLLPAHADPPVSAAVLATSPRSSCYSSCYSCYCYCSRHMLQPLFLLPAHADLPVSAAVLAVLLPAHAPPVTPPAPVTATALLLLLFLLRQDSFACQFHSFVNSH